MIMKKALFKSVVHDLLVEINFCISEDKIIYQIMQFSTHIV